MEAVLNELSLSEPASAGLDERLRELAGIVRALTSLGAGRVLRITRSALSDPVASGESLHQWLQRRDTERELRRFLLGLLTKAPYVEDAWTRFEESERTLCETTHEGKAALGLGAAWLLRGVAVSLPGQGGFAADEVRIRVYRIAEDGTSSDELCEIVHVAAVARLEAQRGRLAQAILGRVDSGAALWARRTELFPHLELCERVEKDLVALTGNEAQFPEICRHLSTLNEVARTWQSGELDPPLDWSYESKATLNDGKLGPMRDFLCPDGVVRRFSAHSKLKAQNVRIFFYPDPEHRKVWVGYVGKKIPTVEYPT